MSTLVAFQSRLTGSDFENSMLLSKTNSLKNSIGCLWFVFQINVKDKQNAKFIESRVSGQDMYAFVCEDKNDQNRSFALFALFVSHCTNPGGFSIL